MLFVFSAFNTSLNSTYKGNSPLLKEKCESKFLAVNHAFLFTPTMTNSKAKTMDHVSYLSSMAYSKLGPL